MKQQTIRQPFFFEGKGLHTGLHINAAFRPAPENSGILICRTDLPGRPCRPALARYVAATERGTVLADGEWRVSTVEHALSALYAMGISNCLIEVDAPEMPILDGSALPYVEAIEKAVIEEQEAEAKVWKVNEAITYTAQNGSTFVIEPSEETQAEVEIHFPGNILHDQTATLPHLSDYPKEISAARTFCFVREILPLLQHGLIKGGDLKNALVIYEQPLSQEQMDSMTDMLGVSRLNATQLGFLSPLHYHNEPARHKLLDLLGDLSLTGVRIIGKIHATRPGHGANTEFAKLLTKHITHNS